MWQLTKFCSLIWRCSCWGHKWIYTMALSRLGMNVNEQSRTRIIAIKKELMWHRTIQWYTSGCRTHSTSSSLAQLVSNLPIIKTVQIIDLFWYLLRKRQAQSQNIITIPIFRDTRHQILETYHIYSDSSRLVRFWESTLVKTVMIGKIVCVLWAQRIIAIFERSWPRLFFVQECHTLCSCYTNCYWRFVISLRSLRSNIFWKYIFPIYILSCRRMSKKSKGCVL